MTAPEISIIVPVYNVEPYLRKCLDSIRRQTWQNIEIILVDDGSTDSSGAICDEYAETDQRIQVIHQPNRGVSAARNAGLRAAASEWIGWVDSDDWIEPDTYEYLLRNAQAADADIVVCGRIEHYRDHCVRRAWGQEQLLNTEQALELLLKNDMMQNFLWDKLWRRSLFEKIIFPEGRTFEDIAVMHRLFIRAERVLCLPEIKYHYLQRSGSIVDNQSLGNRLNHYLAATLRMEEMQQEWPQFHDLMEAQCAASAISIWCAYYRNSRAERKQFRPQLKEAAAFAKGHYRTALQHMKLGSAGRAVLRLTPYPRAWAFALALFFSWLYQRKHGRAL